MSELFAIFRQHLLWGLALWVLFFVAFAALFAGRQLSAFARGVGRVLAGIVVSPFVFIRRAVQGVLAFTRDEEQSYRASDQYLLNKAMLVLQALVIVVTIGVLSAGAVATWNAWVPPSSVRREARDYRKQLDEQRTKSSDATSALAKLDEEWTKQSEVAVANFRREREEARDAARKSLKSTEEIFATYGTERGRETLANLQSYARRVTDLVPRDIQLAKERMDGSWWSWGLASWEPQSLRAWTEHWQRMSLAMGDLANVPVDAIRAKAQPTHPEVKSAAERESATLAAMAEHSQRLDEIASLKWKAAASRALRVIVTFLLFVWTTGALIEAGWLAIRIADDVRRMRIAAAPVVASSVSPSPLLDSTERDVRIPIRDRGDARASLPSGP